MKGEESGDEGEAIKGEYFGLPQLTFHRKLAGVLHKPGCWCLSRDVGLGRVEPAGCGWIPGGRARAGPGGL
jgi:hypothetical protein